MQWCRPVVSERKVVGEDHNTASIQSSQEDGMMVICKGRYPIEVSNSIAVGDGLPDFIPNDTFASDEKIFTLITGINGKNSWILSVEAFDTFFLLITCRLPFHLSI
jgi:hypothetical protein